MLTIRQISFGLLVSAGIALPVRAAVPSCLANSGIPPVVRAEGFAEPVADLILNCSGGTPTPAGQAVPQANLTVYLNVNITSKQVAANLFTESLLIVDEPASAVNPTRPILNCGNNGAPDTASPGVCTIVSTGNPVTTYDGTANGFGAALCDGSSGRPAPNSNGCGRPNVFQGRLGTPDSPGQLNAITFFNVPMDPPGITTNRTFRITNIRANATTLGQDPMYCCGSSQSSLIGTIAISGIQPFIVAGNVQQYVGFVYPGAVKECGTSMPASVSICEGTASAWRPKNISFAVGGKNGVAGNVALPYVYPFYAYNGATNYPPDVAQNYTGGIYNTEAAFQWQNNTTNGPPVPNPPDSVGNVKTTQTNYPLNSIGFGGLNTGINLAGIADSGTRLAVTFAGIPTGGSVQVPSAVYLRRQGTTNSADPTVYDTTATGVLVRTAADASGSGPFSPASGALTPANNTAFYEVLWSDVFSQEQTRIPYTLLNSPPGTTVTATTTLAPTAPDPTVTQASPVPRFEPRLCSLNNCLGLDPAVGVNQGKVTVTMSAPLTVFNPTGQVLLRRAGSPDIAGTGLGFTPYYYGGFADSAQSFEFDLSGAALGAWDVVITPQFFGPVTFPGQFSVVQSPTCTYSGVGFQTAYPASGGQGTLTVTPTPSQCPWSATVNADGPWVTFPARSPATSQVQSFVVAPNPNPQSRNAYVTAPGIPFSVIFQAGTACTYSISQANQTLPASGANISVGGGVGSITLTVTTQAGCPWSQSADQPWITPRTSFSTTGTLTTSYSIAANPGGSRMATLSLAWQTITLTQAPGQPSTIGIFRSGLWQLDTNGTGVFESGQDKSFFLGFPGAIQVVGDWNGDGHSKAGVYSNGYWFLDYDGNGVWDGGVVDKLIPWGWAGVTPIVGDWNGDGKTKIGVYSNGFWFLDYNGDFQWDGGVVDKQIGWGWAGVTPIVGDWNGDGKTKIGVYSNGFWFLDYDGNYVWDGGIVDKQVGWGWAGVTPIVGDWNGDGKTKIGVYSGGYWYLDYDGNYLWEYPAHDQVWSLGWAGTTPVMGDWNGDGRTKAGAFINGFWYLDYNGNGVFDGSGTDRIFAFGMAGDVPVTGKW
jgi:hypothetical protein